MAANAEAPPLSRNTSIELYGLFKGERRSMAHILCLLPSRLPQSTDKSSVRNGNQVGGYNVIVQL